MFSARAVFKVGRYPSGQRMQTVNLLLRLRVFDSRPSHQFLKFEQRRGKLWSGESPQEVWITATGDTQSRT